MFCFYLCTPGMQYLQRLEEGTGSPGIGIRDGCKSTCWWWQLKPGSLQEQHTVLTAEPSLQASALLLKTEPLTVLELPSRQGGSPTNPRRVCLFLPTAGIISTCYCTQFTWFLRPEFLLVLAR